eukprot:g3974.t1
MADVKRSDSMGWGGGGSGPSHRGRKRRTFTGDSFYASVEVTGSPQKAARSTCATRESSPRKHREGSHQNRDSSALQKYELEPHELEEYVRRSREQDAQFREFLAASMDGELSRAERNHVRADDKDSQQKNPFGGYALQLLYLRYQEYTCLKKKHASLGASSVAARSNPGLLVSETGAETAGGGSQGGEGRHGAAGGRNGAGNKSKAGLPWILPGRIERYLIEAESLTLEEAQHLARPRTLLGPSPFEQQYIIPAESVMEMPADSPGMGGKGGKRRRKLPITEKPIPAGYYAYLQQQALYQGGLSQEEELLFHHLTCLAAEVERLGRGQLDLWEQGGDICEMEYQLLEKEGLLPKEMKEIASSPVSSVPALGVEPAASQSAGDVRGEGVSSAAAVTTDAGADAVVETKTHEDSDNHDRGREAGNTGSGDVSRPGTMVEAAGNGPATQAEAEQAPAAVEDAERPRQPTTQGQDGEATPAEGAATDEAMTGPTAVVLGDLSTCRRGSCEDDSAVAALAAPSSSSSSSSSAYATSEKVCGKAIAATKKDALVAQRTADVGFQCLDRYEGCARLRLIRQTYRIRNVGVNPHDHFLFRRLGARSASQNGGGTLNVKELVRFIKEQQRVRALQPCTLVLRNQTRIATKEQLVEAVLSQNANMSARERFLAKLRCVVSVHGRVHAQELPQVWDAFFGCTVAFPPVPGAPLPFANDPQPSFAETLVEADVHPDGVCMLVERVLGEVMTLTPDGFLEEKMHAVTSRDVDLGKESPWDFSAALDEEGVGTCAAIPQATAGAVAAEP